MDRSINKGEPIKHFLMTGIFQERKFWKVFMKKHLVLIHGAFKPPQTPWEQKGEPGSSPTVTRFKRATGLILTGGSHGSTRGSKTNKQTKKRQIDFSPRPSSDAVTLVAIIKHRADGVCPADSLNQTSSGASLVCSGFSLVSVLRCSSPAGSGGLSVPRHRRYERVHGPTSVAGAPPPVTRSSSVTWVPSDAAVPASGARNPSSRERRLSTLSLRTFYLPLPVNHRPLKSSAVTSSPAKRPAAGAIKLLSSACLLLLPPPPLKSSPLLTLPPPP